MEKLNCPPFPTKGAIETFKLKFIMVGCLALITRTKLYYISCIAMISQLHILYVLLIRDQ